MVGLAGLPIVWAQSSGTGTPSLAALALRRWYSSLTLSSPEPVPSLFGLWAWLAGLAALVGLAMALQGPSRTLRQAFDLAGHVRLAGEALGRIRRSGRVVAVTIGMTVVAWTAGQVRTYNLPQGRDDLLLLMKSRSLGELALEQGIMAALTPLRDVFGLGDTVPLLIVATILVFRARAEGWGGPYLPPSLRPPRKSGWGNVVWVAGAVYLIYRLVSMSSGTGDLPVGGCLMIEAIVVPGLMVVLDGALLGWVLVELRNASLGDTGNDTFDTEPAVGLLPGTALACLAALPARYVATAVLLASYSLPGSAASAAVGRLVRWQLSWGLADLQGAALATAGLAGAVAWSRGGVGAAVRGYLRLLSAEGGRLAAVLVLAGLAAGTLSSLAYLLVLALPTQTWVLSAADGYAHYASLPVGLLALSAIVELGERSLPEAGLASDDPS